MSSTAPTIVGEHVAHWRRVARCARAITREPLPRWGTEFASDSEMITAITRTFARVRQVGDVITWVPGHDGDGGPGREVAIALSRLWHVPAVPLLGRRELSLSAHDALVRPTLEEQLSSLDAVRDATDSTVTLVDNTIASGSSMFASAIKLRSSGYRVVSLVALSIDTQVYRRSEVGADRWTRVRRLDSSTTVRPQRVPTQ